MRHYPLMPLDLKSNDDLLAKSSRAKADKRVIYEMAELARRLGFQSPEIKARKPNCIQYDEQQLDTLISRIVECFSAAIPDQPKIIYKLLADSTVKPQVRYGMPQMRTHKQDSPLLFVDRLYTKSKNNRETPGDGDIPPLSPLFVGEDEPYPQPVGARQVAEQQTLARQQTSRGRSERNVARRRRMLQARRRGLRPKGKSNQDPMDVEWLSTEHSDVDMSEQEAPEPPKSSTVLTRREPLDESITTDSPAATTAHPGSLERNTFDQTSDNGSHGTRSLESVLRPMHGSANHEDADTNSQCTRISLGSVSHEQDLAETSIIDHPHESVAPDRTRVDGLQPQSSISEQDSPEEEQERLEEELERERLEEELGVYDQEQPALEVSPLFQERQDLLSSPPDHEPVQAPRSTDSTPTPDSTPISPREGQIEPQVESLAVSSPRVPASNPNSQRSQADDDRST
ncbi:hypothetical protein KXW34_004883 [Aspergillus fumigatus]|nr:hypothetical protein KXW34_004883 [Aspergillus fumigatus]